MVRTDLFSDGEIDQRCLGLYLRRVMWVGQLGVQEQSEGTVVLHVLVT